jgi:glycosyltransferase involved in cell wall biosynthesis
VEVFKWIYKEVRHGVDSMSSTKCKERKLHSNTAGTMFVGEEQQRSWGAGISIIVPTKNAEIKKLSQQFAQISEPLRQEAFEVIFVDQTEGRLSSSRILDSQCNHILTQKPRSAISARQYGAKIAKYPNLLFCDDDVCFESSSLEVLMKFLRSDKGVDYCVISPILFDSAHSSWFIFLRAVVEVLIFGAGDRRAINRALEWFNLPHVEQAYLWGGAFLVNGRIKLNGKPIIELVICEGRPIQHGDILLGSEIVRQGGDIKTIAGLRCVHHDPNYGRSDGFIDARMKQADYEGYNFIRRALYKLLLKGSLWYRAKNFRR